MLRLLLLPRQGTGERQMSVRKWEELQNCKFHSLDYTQCRSRT